MAPAPNWRSPDDYAYLNELTPPELAWEFLRRNPEYVRDYRKLLPLMGTEAPAAIAALRWGLPFPD